MKFNLETAVQQANAAYFGAGQSAEIPVVWNENVLIPVRLLKPEDDPYDETQDWPDDHKLDDPRRGQAKHINSQR